MDIRVQALYAGSQLERARSAAGLICSPNADLHGPVTELHTIPKREIMAVVVHEVAAGAASARRPDQRCAVGSGVVLAKILGW